MAGTYGSILPAFSEQLRQVTYYKADPLVGAGYEEPEEVEKIYVVFQRFGSAPYNAALTVPTAGENISNTNGNTQLYRQIMIWCEDRELEEQRFVKRKINGKDEIYKIVANNGWNELVGCYVCLAERVMGDNGSNTTVVTPNLGENLFR